MSTTHSRGTGGLEDHTDLTAIQLEMRLRPGDGYSCPLVFPFPPSDVDAEIIGIEYTKRDSECLTNFVLANGDVVTCSGESAGESCLCDTFQESDCVPKFTGVENGWLHVTTHITSREHIRPLVSALESVVDTVVIDRLVMLESNDSDDLVLFDRSILTDKQLEALELAVKRGYYANGTDVTLSDLSSELGITQSALSDRLRTAHSKLVTDLF